MWKPVIKSEALKKSIESKLVEISDCLGSHPERSSPFSLVQESGGYLLFNSYFNLYKRREDQEKQLENFLVGILNGFELSGTRSLCYGISGTLWTLDNLHRSGFIELDRSLFRESAEFMNNTLLSFSSNNNFDYLHGAFGTLLYLITCEGTCDHKKVEECLTAFVEKSDNKETLARQVVLNASTQLRGYSLGLSHGTPSVILILVRYLKKRESKIAREILEKSLNYLLSVKFDPNDREYYFPITIVDGKPTNGKLAWCYGDLGCALALYEAGLFLKREDLISLGLEVFKFAASKRGVELQNIADADFCHGTAGLAHFFCRMYNYTDLEEFREASEYWFGETLNLASFKHGYAGFAHYNGLTRDYDKKLDLLEGISGIGLTFISGLSDIEPKWDECFLLS